MDNWNSYMNLLPFRIFLSLSGKRSSKSLNSLFVNIHSINLRMAQITTSITGNPIEVLGLLFITHNATMFNIFEIINSQKYFFTFKTFYMQWNDFSKATTKDKSIVMHLFTGVQITPNRQTLYEPLTLQCFIGNMLK